MKSIFKLISVIGIGFLMYWSFMFGRLQLIEGKHIVNPYLDTKFAEKYTPEKFNKIKIGMSLDEVKEIIGEPLQPGKSYNNSPKVYFGYTSDGKLLDKRKSTGSNSDLAWYNSSLVIDEDKKVIRINKGWMFD